MADEQGLPDIVVFTFILNTKDQKGEFYGNVPAPAALSILQSMVMNFLIAQAQNGGHNEVARTGSESQD